MAMETTKAKVVKADDFFIADTHVKKQVKQKFVQYTYQDTYDYE